MKITELYPDVITEGLNYELKTVLSQDNPLKWAKTIVRFANGEGGIIFVGVNDNRDAFGLSIEEIDKMKNLVVQINDRHIFHMRNTHFRCAVWIMMRNGLFWL